MSASSHSDAIVVGGGLVGSAIAWGLVRQGLAVTLLDEGDDAFRASRGNFGLVWVQGKGDRISEYALWTRASADLWPQFSRELQEICGIDVEYEKPGGFALCMSEDEYAAREALLLDMKGTVPGGYDFRMIDRTELRQMMPHIGDKVVGASYCPHDGHANPLLLLRALHSAMHGKVDYRPGAPVHEITHRGGTFTIGTPEAMVSAPKIVLAAGLANRRLAPMVGLSATVNPLRGQIIVTERITPRFDHLTIYVRQTGDGTVMLGDSHEDVGFDTGTTVGVGRDIARRAIDQFPDLARARVVRTWAALRIMTPDGYPIYQESPAQPGAFVANCHSGVTLAAVHANRLAVDIAAGTLSNLPGVFGGDRFKEKT